MGGGAGGYKSCSKLREAQVPDGWLPGSASRLMAIPTQLQLSRFGTAAAEEASGWGLKLGQLPTSGTDTA